MNITCPHCSQTLELTPEVLIALQGQPNFACPACEGLMTVPAPPPSAPQRTGPRKSASTITTAQRGLNRNLLVLGVVTLVILGGVAVFLASKNGGNIFNIFQNVTNQIIHNSYFTQLIADGVTTEKDLEAIAEIRPYGGGFIGTSKEALSWNQAQELSKRTGASVLSIEDSGAGSKQELVDWLNNTLESQMGTTLWVQEDGQAKALDKREVLGVTALDNQRKVALHWKPNAGGMTSEPALTTKEQEIEIAPGVKMTFVWCPPGSLRRQKKNLFDEVEVVGTEITLTKGFWIGKYEVTQEQWAAVIGNNPSHFKGRTLPVETVDWNNANTFLKKVGKGFRLPTEAEWEYACRAGSLTKYCFGDDAAELADYAWYGDDNGQTHPVGQKKPNAWGIHDMHGNVWEWCQDWKGEDYWDVGYEGSRTDPSGPTSGSDRVNRGGGWNGDTTACQSAQRGWVPQAWFSMSYLGFRVAMSSAE